LQESVGYNIDMTNEEAIKFYEELKEHFGKDLVNFEVYPKQFAYQVKLYKYYKERQNESGSV
jgi:hypothetical protein